MSLPLLLLMEFFLGLQQTALHGDLSPFFFVVQALPQLLEIFMLPCAYIALGVAHYENQDHYLVILSMDLGLEKPRFTSQLAPALTGFLISCFLLAQ